MVKPIDDGRRITRRDSLKKAAGAFMILPAGLARGYAANEKLNIGVIGLAGIGGVDAKTFSDLGQNIAALCDPDSAALERRAAEYPNAKKYTDFRKMVETEKLDAVSVSVPDHSHAYISVWAMKHGLHTYCQKPLCQSVHEARLMARVAAQTKVITQMGTASTSSPNTLRTVELIQSGALGEVTEIHLATDRPIWPQGHDRLQREDPVPAGMNWDLWLLQRRCGRIRPGGQKDTRSTVPKGRGNSSQAAWFTTHLSGAVGLILAAGPWVISLRTR